MSASFDITPILNAIYTAINGVATFVANVVSSFFGALGPYGQIIAIIGVIGVVSALVARTFGFDVLGFVRSITSRITGVLSGAL